MKKRCTNSACRRVFRFDPAAAMPVCPHCGRVYPHWGFVQLQITGCQPGQKVPVIRALMDIQDCKFSVAIRQVRSLDRQPALLLEPMPVRQGCAALEALTASGAIATALRCDQRRPDASRLYDVVMTGFRPGKRSQAEALIRRTVAAPASAKKAAAQLGSREFLLARRVSREEAAKLVEETRAMGVFAHMRWCRAA